jgi:hypothetical protein
VAACAELMDVHSIQAACAELCCGWCLKAHAACQCGVRRGSLAQSNKSASITVEPLVVVISLGVCWATLADKFPYCCSSSAAVCVGAAGLQWPMVVTWCMPWLSRFWTRLAGT